MGYRAGRDWSPKYYEYLRFCSNTIGDSRCQGIDVLALGLQALVTASRSRQSFSLTIASGSKLGSARYLHTVLGGDP